MTSTCSSTYAAIEVFRNSMMSNHMEALSDCWTVPCSSEGKRRWRHCWGGHRRGYRSGPVGSHFGIGSSQWDIRICQQIHRLKVPFLTRPPARCCRASASGSCPTTRPEAFWRISCSFWCRRSHAFSTTSNPAWRPSQQDERALQSTRRT